MHNSLFIRDLLRKVASDPMRIERSNPHRSVHRDPAATAQRGEFELAGSWAIRCSADPGVASLLVSDLTDFLMRMGVSVAERSDRVIEILPSSDLGARDCRLSCSPNRITIAGGEIAGLWAGVAWLEWEVRTRRGPFLPEGDVTRRAQWGTQISQGPWLGNYAVPDLSEEYLPDEALRLYAHYGVNSMMIYGDLLCYVQSAIFPELNCAEHSTHIATLKKAAQRAARYGVQFSYLVVGPKLNANHPLFQRLPEVRGSGLDFGGPVFHVLCSGHPLVQRFYGETFSKLFREVPELAGLILIVAGESFYHCWIRVKAAVPCPRCTARAPEAVIAEAAGIVDRAVKSAQPRAWVAAWAYSPIGWERTDRADLVRRLPEGVVHYQHIEKDHDYQKAGYRKSIWDYSVDFIGPSDNIVRTAQVARETGKPLFVKTETGVGLEVFQFPYVPAMQRLADKWQKVRELKPAGVQQSWLFFGMFGSRAEELGLWAAYAPEMPRDQFLNRIAVRDFGPDVAPSVLEAWACMSRAVGHIPCIWNYYKGPSFLGPAHPLVSGKDAEIPDVFHAYLFYLQEQEETFSRKRIDQARVCLVLSELPESASYVGISWDGPSDGWDIVIAEYSAAVKESEAAWRLLVDAEPRCRLALDRKSLADERLLTELIYRTMLSCENTVRFLKAQKRYEQNGEASMREEMKRIALAEKANAQAAKPIYDAAPWLNLSGRIDGKFPRCQDMIEEKIRWIDRFLGASPAA